MRKTILACLAIAMIVGATSATAATLITSSQIKNGTIQNRDIKKGAVSINRLTQGTQSLIRRAASLGANANSSQPGAQGAPGTQGAQGDAGSNGTNGTNGANGQNGQVGPQGPQGEEGDDGAAGPQGAPGRDGLNPAVPVRTVGEQGWNQSNGANSPASIKWGELYFEGDARTGLRKEIASAANPTGIPCLPTALKYFFRVDNRAAGLKTAPAIKLEVRGANRTDAPANGSTFTTLVLEPTYQPLRDAAREGEINGLAPGNKWWSSNPINGAPDRDTFVSIQEICAANPGAHIDAILFEAGSGNGAGFAAGGDELLFNDTRYDFGG